MEYYAALKNNENSLYILIWKLSNVYEAKKKARCKKGDDMLPFVWMKKDIYVYKSSTNSRIIHRKPNSGYVGKGVGGE